MASLKAVICIICAHSWLYMFTVQENKIDFSFLSTFIMSVQMNVGHIPARSIFMQPTLEKARELQQSSRGSCNFFSCSFLFSRFSVKFVCIILRAHCQLKGVLMKGAPLVRLARGAGGDGGWYDGGHDGWYLSSPGRSWAGGFLHPATCLWPVASHASFHSQKSNS